MLLVGRSERDAPFFCKSLRRVASRGLADTVYALCNSVAINLCSCNLADTLAPAQNDDWGGFNGFWWVLMFFFILNAVKNLSVRVDGGAIVDGHGIADGRAIPEILRFTQDDILE